jgi:hypothetical protein
MTASLRNNVSLTLLWAALITFAKNTARGVTCDAMRDRKDGNVLALRIVGKGDIEVGFIPAETGRLHFPVDRKLGPDETSALVSRLFSMTGDRTIIEGGAARFADAVAEIAVEMMLGLGGGPL